MKCSKCGFDNPEDAIFCEKCDWKLGETYIPEVKVNKSIVSVVALILGAVSLVPILTNGNGMIGLVCGALGLVLGGYSFNITRAVSPSGKNLMLACGAAGLMLSVIGFIYGLTMVFA